MKRILSFFILLSLLAPVCLTVSGCNSTSNYKGRENRFQSNNSNNSIIVLPGVESGVFKERFLYSGPEATEEIVTSDKVDMIKIGNSNFEARQIKRIRNADQTVTNVYGSEDGKFEYSINGSKKSFFISACKDAVLQEYGSEKITEEELLSQIKDYVVELIPNDNLEKYTTTCSTKIVVQNPDSAWSEIRESFSMPKNEHETVQSFVFDFRMFNQGIRTSDSIMVRCNENGDLKSVEYLDNGVDWNSVSVDHDSLLERAKGFVVTAISDEYTVKSISVLSETLVVFDSMIRVFAKCELSLERDGAEIGVLCPLIMDP